MFEFLREVRPWLVVKGEQADVAIRAREAVGKPLVKRTLTQEGILAWAQKALRDLKGGKTVPGKRKGGKGGKKRPPIQAEKGQY